MAGEKDTAPVDSKTVELNQKAPERLRSVGSPKNKEKKIMISENNVQREIDKVLKLTKNPRVIAVDTEYEKAETLSVQIAFRANIGEIAVQMYASPSIPKLSNRQCVEASITAPKSKYNPFIKNVDVRAVKTITSDFSPVTLIADVEGLQHAKPLSRSEGEKLLSDSSATLKHSTWNPKKQQWIIPSITLRITGLALPADIGRSFGADFNKSIFRNDNSKPSGIKLRNYRSISYRSGKRNGKAPVVQYLRITGNCICEDDFICEIRIEFCDLMHPFNSASLDKHSQTFLGFGKSEDLTTDDKRHMSKTFQTKTNETYKYALFDVLNTLLIYEQMILRDREIYEKFCVPIEQIPQFAGTCGRRVRNFLETMACRHAAGSKYLNKPVKLTRQMKRGGFGHFRARNSSSHYGEQTSKVFGGLAMSRCPTQFFHHAPGMLRDVDMSGCYTNIIGRINVYLGKPIVLEPGNRNMTLAEAIALVEQVSPNDGYYITVTGNFIDTNNVLIPSAIDAVTFKNFRQKRSQQECDAARQDIDPENRDSEVKLFSKQVEQGVVTHATWTVIESLPAYMRREYQQLRVESIVFYHNDLIANDGAQFDKLYEERFNMSLPWSSSTLGSTELVYRVKLDHDYVALRFPICEVATALGEHRQTAKSQFGKGSGQELALKIQANSMYGVLCSKHHTTANIVAANVITAHARAAAYIMQMLLNGLQVITDGCTYRLDQIPSCSFEECLRIKPDYCLQRPSNTDGIPFHGSTGVPLDDSAFTAWFQENAIRFFGNPSPGFRELVTGHPLEHKTTENPDRSTFDAMTTDGSGNYIKLVESDNRLQVADSKLRGFSSAVKKVLLPWITDTYRNDCMSSPPPILKDTKLLKLDQAIQVARRCFSEFKDLDELVLPLFMELGNHTTYKVLKPSAFIFQTQKQYKTMKKATENLQRELGIDLDMLLLRRSLHGSLKATAEAIYEYIQTGEVNFTRKFNLRTDRLPKDQVDLTTRFESLAQMRHESLVELADQINLDKLTSEARLTGIHVTEATLQDLS